MVTIIKKESTSDTKRMTIKVYRFKFVVSCCVFCNQDSSANSPVQAVVWGGGGGIVLEAFGLFCCPRLRSKNHQLVAML